MPRLQAATLREIGLVNETRGDLDKALESYTAALKLTKPGEDQHEYAYTLAYAGHVHEQLKQVDRALNCYGEALRLSQRSDDPVGEALVHFNVAHLERNRGNLAEAKWEAEATLAIVESQRAVSGQSGSANHLLRDSPQTYDLYINILMQLHKQDPVAGFDRQPLQLARKPELDLFWKCLAKQGPSTTRLLPELLSLPDVQQRLLDDDTLLVEYALGDDQSYVWLVTRTSFASYELAPRGRLKLRRANSMRL
jgi:tetratricopeptide (TPR) repeat protein